VLVVLIILGVMVAVAVSVVGGTGGNTLPTSLHETTDLGG
jgi:hypothetical protein